jgi:LysM repeat protein
MNKKTIFVVAPIVVISLASILFLLNKEGHLENAKEYFNRDTVVTGNDLTSMVPDDRERRSPITHLVIEEETLSSIAKSYEISENTIIKANNLTSTDVEVGMELIIPPADGLLITVEKGDTLESLSKKYSVDEQAIADFNWLDYPFTLVQGQELFIPDAQ